MTAWQVGWVGVVPSFAIKLVKQAGFLFCYVTQAKLCSTQAALLKIGSKKVSAVV